jgi:hypothetical protein
MTLSSVRLISLNVGTATASLSRCSATGAPSRSTRMVTT